MGMCSCEYTVSAQTQHRGNYDNIIIKLHFLTLFFRRLRNAKIYCYYYNTSSIKMWKLLKFNM